MSGATGSNPRSDAGIDNMLTYEPFSDEDMVLPYRAMAYNNAWSNYRLLRACAQLSQDEFTEQRTGFIPSLRATLNHILIIDRFYVAAMEGRHLGPAAWSDPAVWNGCLASASAGIRGPPLAGCSAEPGQVRPPRVVSVHRGHAIQMNVWTACCSTSFSIRLIIACRPSP